MVIKVLFFKESFRLTEEMSSFSSSKYPLPLNLVFKLILLISNQENNVEWKIDKKKPPRSEQGGYF